MPEAMVEAIHVIVVVLESVGVLAMVAGIVVAVVFAVRVLARRGGGAVAFHTLRNMIGSSILLGLEILVAADLIRTLLGPTLQDAIVLGIIVVIRTVLSFTIQIEIEGTLPWKRALTTSGGALLAGAIAEANRPTPGAAPATRAEDSQV